MKLQNTWNLRAHWHVLNNGQASREILLHIKNYVTVGKWKRFRREKKNSKLEMLRFFWSELWSSTRQFFSWFPNVALCCRGRGAELAWKGRCRASRCRANIPGVLGSWPPEMCAACDYRARQLGWQLPSRRTLSRKETSLALPGCTTVPWVFLFSGSSHHRRPVRSHVPQSLCINYVIRLV